MLLALHVEHPVGNLLFVLRCHVLHLVDQARLVLLPVHEVASALERHRRCRQHVVLVERHCLALVGRAAMSDVPLVSTRSYLMASCPCEADALGAAVVLKFFALVVAHLCKVGLEGGAERVESLCIAGHAV